MMFVLPHWTDLFRVLYWQLAEAVKDCRHKRRMYRAAVARAKAIIDEEF